MYFYDGKVSHNYLNDENVSRIDGASVTIILCLHVLMARFRNSFSGRISVLVPVISFDSKSTLWNTAYMEINIDNFGQLQLESCIMLVRRMSDKNDALQRIK